MSDAEQKVIKKIQALLNLSESNNPHEALRAMERAQYFIEKYSISLDQLKQPQEFVQALFWEGKHLFLELEYVCPVLIAFFHVRFNLLEPDEHHQHLNTQLVGFGLPHHVKIAGQLFVFLLRQYQFLFEKVVTESGLASHYTEEEWAILEPNYRRDFLRGVVANLFSRLSESEEVLKQELQQEGLVLVPDTKLEELMGEQEQECRALGIWKETERELAPMGQTYSGALYLAGEAYGSTIQLRTMLEAERNPVEKPHHN